MKKISLIEIAVIIGIVFIIYQFAICREYQIDKNEIIKDFGTITEYLGHKKKIAVQFHVVCPYSDEILTFPDDAILDHVIGSRIENKEFWSDKIRNKLFKDKRYIYIVSKKAYIERDGKDIINWLPHKDFRRYFLEDYYRVFKEYNIKPTDKQMEIIKKYVKV